MGESLKRQAVKGVAWSAVERFSVQGVQFVLSIILARLVAPSEYGLIAMLGIFLAIAQSFIDSGFSNALIQKKDRTETDYSTVFYFNIVVAGIVYGILFLCSPYVAGFYKEPQLETITKWIGLNIILSAFSIVQRAKLSIKLDFKTQTKASLLSVIVSGCIGITLAYQGFGVWALVIQALSSSLLNTLLLWIFAKWRPSLIFSWASFKILFSFGSKLLLGGLMHTIYMNLYTLVIGRQFSAVNVGYFNRSQTLAMFPSTNITEVIGRVMYPSLCSIQDEEEKLKNVFLQYLRVVSFIVFPLMIGVSVLSKPLIQVVLTDKWLSAAPLLSILCIAYMWQPIMIINWQILNVRGRSDLALKSEIVKKITAFVILFSTIPLGIKGMCWGLLIYSFVDITIILQFVKRVMAVNYWIEIKSFTSVFISSLLMGISVYLIIQLVSNPLIKLIVGGMSGIILYFGFAILFKFEEISLIKKKYGYRLWHR
ncbi:Teichuronic acid biosynthesis protein TuaB [termite gut metagenome]|uniref:Teichuronic acid biosynthesis protein TuaB n=1 Tax=termite gut metagenome TaxID=433724 RepID=A0A5J4S9J1_9ZZZZ